MRNGITSKCLRPHTDRYVEAFGACLRKHCSRFRQSEEIGQKLKSVVGCLVSAGAHAATSTVLGLRGHRGAASSAISTCPTIYFPTRGRQSLKACLPWQITKFYYFKRGLTQQRSFDFLSKAFEHSLDSGMTILSGITFIAGPAGTADSFDGGTYKGHVQKWFQSMEAE